MMTDLFLYQTINTTITYSIKCVYVPFQDRKTQRGGHTSSLHMPTCCCAKLVLLSKVLTGVTVTIEFISWATHQ